MTLVFVTICVIVMCAFVIHLVNKEYDGPDELWLDYERD